jgi:thymidylate synthase (FAD)
VYKNQQIQNNCFGVFMKVELLSVTPNAEKTIELAGRSCYQSYEKQTADSYERFIKMLIKSGHFSVLEHASATFRISGVSRALTHQLVRHRVASYSQKSQRYVSEIEFEYVVPDKIKNNKEAMELYKDVMNYLNKNYKKMASMNIPKEDARYILPNACSTEIVVTANFREYRHIFELRCHPKAQLEIRKVAIKMLEELKKVAPVCFYDLIIDYDNMKHSCLKKI